MSNTDFADRFIRAHDEAMYHGNFDALEKLVDLNVALHGPASGQDALVGWERWSRTCSQNQAAKKVVVDISS